MLNWIVSNKKNLVPFVLADKKITNDMKTWEKSLYDNITNMYNLMGAIFLKFKLNYTKDTHSVYKKANDT